MSKTRIIVCCHRPSSVIKNDDMHLPIHVGKALSNLDLGFQGDDEGENISDKNKSYCELTGQYWAWKNLNNAEYIGLAHYRRYFFGVKTTLQVEKLLKNKYDVVLLDRTYEVCSNRMRFEQLVTMEDMAILLEVIRKHHPNYYSSAVNYLCNSNRWVRCNMFIMKKEAFHHYSEWLFDVLDKVEENSIVSGYGRIKRIFGYMGEILLGIYVEHKKMRIKYTAAEEYVSEALSTKANRIAVLKIKYPNFWSTSTIWYRRILFFKRSVAFKMINRKVKAAYIQPDVISGLKSDGIHI